MPELEEILKSEIVVMDQNAVRVMQTPESMVFIDLDGIFWNLHSEEARKGFLQAAIKNFGKQVKKLSSGDGSFKVYGPSVDLEGIIGILDRLGSGWMLDRKTGYALRLNNRRRVIDALNGKEIFTRTEIEQEYPEEIDFNEQLRLEQKIEEGGYYEGKRNIPRYRNCYEGYDKVELAFFMYLKSKFDIPESFEVIREAAIHALQALHHHEIGYKGQIRKNPEAFGIKFNQAYTRLMYGLRNQKGRRVVVGTAAGIQHAQFVLSRVLYRRSKKDTGDPEDYYQKRRGELYLNRVHAIEAEMSKPDDLVGGKLDEVMGRVLGSDSTIIFVDDNLFNLRGLKHRQKRLAREGKKLAIATVAVLSRMDYEHIVRQIASIPGADPFLKGDRLIFSDNVNPDHEGLDYITKMAIKYADIITTDLAHVAPIFFPGEQAA